MGHTAGGWPGRKPRAGLRVGKAALGMNQRGQEGFWGRQQGSVVGWAQGE